MEKKDRRQWRAPNMTEYGSVEELTANTVKYYGADDGVALDPDGPDGPDDPDPIGPVS